MMFLEPFWHVVRRIAPNAGAVFKEVAQRARAGEPTLACFDADGTIWEEDIGEAMLRWLAAGRLLPKVRAPWERVYYRYERLVLADRCAGYAWAVAVMAGIKEENLTRWCEQFAAAWPNYRPKMLSLIAGLTDLGVEVAIVSATSRWLVEAAMRRVKLGSLKVLGIETKVEKGKLTREILEPVPCGKGKVLAIRKHFGRMPDLAVGDSIGDLEMLEAAQRAVVVARRGEKETEMLKIARARGWPVLWF